MSRVIFVLFLLGTFAGCSSSTPGATDTGSTPRDAAATPDAAGDDADIDAFVPPLDTGTADTGTADTGGAADTGSADTGTDAPAFDAGEAQPGECAPGPCTPTCFRPYECVTVCGGPATSCGCCPCAEGSIDTILCPPAPPS